MELFFDSNNTAEASYLAQELESTLRRRGIPAAAMTLKPSSPENMDVGSVLWISIEAVNQVLSPLGAIATIAAAIHQIIAKHNRGVTVDNEGSKVKISPSKVSAARIEAALARSPRPKKRSRD